MIDMTGIYIPFRPETYGYTGVDKIKIESGLYDQTARLKVFDFIKICKALCSSVISPPNKANFKSSLDTLLLSDFVIGTS